MNYMLNRTLTEHYFVNILAFEWSNWWCIVLTCISISLSTLTLRWILDHTTWQTFITYVAFPVNINYNGLTMTVMFRTILFWLSHCRLHKRLKVFFKSLSIEISMYIVVCNASFKFLSLLKYVMSFWKEYTQSTFSNFVWAEVFVGINKTTDTLQCFDYRC